MLHTVTLTVNVFVMIFIDLLYVLIVPVQEFPCVGGLDGAFRPEGTLRRMAGTGRHTPGAQPTFGRVYPWPRPRGGHQRRARCQVTVLVSLQLPRNQLDF